ncbi:hypothetical protein AVEN_59853-1 [Araneus ventricosus]|uniref:Pre-C2HC domain-containing protein n=1 Tax=Araneus ventricosus TaxID=182803 RepID=A0A4Y2PG81_ARAVE|nr:hypothetical protein AVEN_270144-1 [Araneus ventricosus]GBN51008.1 hypothetical protein AVEN_226567-1 [Araneus ventricosus]GBN51020.1 hypothetical protein AVEN_59853-1 [Araneus ventricosus]
MDISEIIQNLVEKGYRIGRVSQMKNYKEKRSLPLYLVDVQKYGNYANIFNEKQICYLKVKVVPYKQRKKQQFALTVLDTFTLRGTAKCAPGALSAMVNIQPENAA